MTAYWPWWAGAVALAVLTIGYALATDRSFGVSGAWERVLHCGAKPNWSAWRRGSPMNGSWPRPPPRPPLSTSEHFGTTPEPSAPAAVPDPAVRRRGGPPCPAPLVTQAVLLVSVFVGGLVVAVTSGRFRLRLDLRAGYRDVVTGNPVVMVVLLFVGGVLVGFGTRLAGGCTPGHGLNGCGRLNPVGLVATATFCATAVVVSFLLGKVI